MKLTIIPSDSFVSVDGDGSHQSLDLSKCGIPINVHALQWFDTKGWIEFVESEDPFAPKPANEIIEALPTWAEVCALAWQQSVAPVVAPTGTQPPTTGT